MSAQRVKALRRLKTQACKEFVMPGIRVDRFVASTAVMLLLSAAGGAFAHPSAAAPASASPALQILLPRRPQQTTTPDTTVDGSTAQRPRLRASIHRAPPRRALPHRRDDASPHRPRPDAAPDAAIADQLHDLASGKFDQPHRQQESPYADRRFLFRPQLRAALDHRRQGQCARHRGGRLSGPCRCRRAVPVRLSGAEFRLADRAGRRSPMPKCK